MKLDLVEIRRDLHRHPELAFCEERTAGVVSAHLESLGLAPRRCAGTGVIVDIDSGKPGPLVALRADMDALPVQEATGLPFASEEEGKSHACGHDSHTAILLGAAELLCAERSNWRGSVRLLFQPAEESIGGARAFVEAGALAGVKAVFGLHNDPFLPVGQIAVQAGPVMAAADCFTIHLTGKGGHAGMPNLTTDPLLAAAAVTMALQTAVSRAANPLDPLVVSVTQFHAGKVFNVIPDHAELNGTCRYLARELSDTLPDLLQTIAGGVASGYRCSAEVKYEKMVPAVDNDAALAELLKEVGQRELGPENVVRPGMTMVSEDFSHYQRVAPGCFFRLGSGGKYGYHHPAFVIDEGCLPIGARMMAAAACAAASSLS